MIYLKSLNQRINKIIIKLLGKRKKKILIVMKIHKLISILTNWILQILTMKGSNLMVRILIYIKPLINKN